MSLAAFQRAFADLAGSPALCLAVRRNPAALEGYALTERERRRLAEAAGQRGMDAQCSMYRVTRIAALNSIVPLSLAALKPHLRELVDAYWARNPVHELRFVIETQRFLDFLAAEPGLLSAAAGDAAAALLDLARLELAMEEVRLGTPQPGAAPLARLLALSHEVDALLAAAPGGLVALALLPRSPNRALIAAEAGMGPKLYRLPDSGEATAAA